MVLFSDISFDFLYFFGRQLNATVVKSDEYLNLWFLVQLAQLKHYNIGNCSFASAHHHWGIKVNTDWLWITIMLVERPIYLGTVASPCKACWSSRMLVSVSSCSRHETKPPLALNYNQSLIYMNSQKWWQAKQIYHL